jgi:hypothetical protein
MSVHLLRVPAAAPADRNPVASSPIGGDDAPTCTLSYIARELGRRDYGDRRMVRYVGLLIAERRFPPPIPVLVGKALVTEVTRRSIWRREAVDAWFVELMPAPVARAVETLARNAAADEMRRRAERLGGRGA